jgi:hypothetical protein
VYLVSAGVLGLSTAGVQRVVVDASGNVGIGTASPARRLDVQGAGSGETYQLRLGATSTNSYDIGRSTTDGYLRLYGNQAAAYGYIFDGAGGERARIDYNGNLLVGTTSTILSGAKLQVNSTVAALAYACRSNTTFSPNGFNINWTGSAQLWIDGTNVGTFAFTSDYRIKKNIETQEQPALERIAKLRPVKYELADYKELFKADGVQREGFIAHELQAVIPSAVDGKKDAEDQIQSLKLDALCSVMVKAIQEQQEIIGKLEARLAALESK